MILVRFVLIFLLTCDVDPRGRIKLSIKELLDDEQDADLEEAG